MTAEITLKVIAMVHIIALAIVILTSYHNL